MTDRNQEFFEDLKDHVEREEDVQVMVKDVWYTIVDRQGETFICWDHDHDEHEFTVEDIQMSQVGGD